MRNLKIISKYVMWSIVIMFNVQNESTGWVFIVTYCVDWCLKIYNVFVFAKAGRFE